MRFLSSTASPAEMLNRPASNGNNLLTYREWNRLPTALLHGLPRRWSTEPPASGARSSPAPCLPVARIVQHRGVSTTTQQPTDQQRHLQPHRNGESPAAGDLLLKKWVRSTRARARRRGCRGNARARSATHSVPATGTAMRPAHEASHPPYRSEVPRSLPGSAIHLT